MYILVEPFLQKADIFLLVFIRIISFLMIVPFFSGKNIPRQTKIIFAFFLSISAFWNVDSTRNILSTSLIQYSFIIFKEFLIGWILGFLVYIIFSVFYLAGQLIDFQIGFSMVSVFDPLSQIQVPITGNLYYLISIVILVILDAHHYLIKALVYSFNLLPIGETYINISIYQQFIDVITEIFILSIKIASPIIATIFIINIALGILVRVVPQMNMFVVGVPIKIVVGILVLIVFNPVLSNVIDYVINLMNELIFNLIRGMAP